VVGADTGTEVGIKLFPVEPRSMAIDHSCSGAGDLAQDLFISVYNTREVHHLPEPEGILPGECGSNVFSCQSGTRSLKLGGRNADAQGRVEIKCRKCGLMIRRTLSRISLQQPSLIEPRRGPGRIPEPKEADMTAVGEWQKGDKIGDARSHQRS
jgi:hypothetical protein